MSYRKGEGVSHGDLMPHRNSIVSVESHGSYGCHIFDHLTADGACFLGGEVTVVSLLEVYADFCGCFHLETVECFFCFGNEISVVGHNKNIPFRICFFESEFIFSLWSFFVSIKALCERFLRSDVIMSRDTEFISGKFWIKQRSIGSIAKLCSQRCRNNQIILHSKL